MILLVIGLYIGAQWGTGYALLGAAAGVLLSNFINGASGDYPEKTIIEGDEFCNVDCGYSEEVSTNNDSFCDTNLLAEEFMDVNPANGLPMLAGSASLDVAGNFYGCDDHGFDHSSMTDNDVLSTSAFDDSEMYDAFGDSYFS